MATRMVADISSLCVYAFRVVLAVTAVFEQYVEFFVSWFPFYYLFKCAFLGLLLVPSPKVRLQLLLASHSAALFSQNQRLTRAHVCS